MSSYLTVENVSKSYVEYPLFENISIAVNQGQKVALIAANGAGKSTLLKIIMGKESPDKGKVVFRNDLSIGFLDQSPVMDENATVLETLFNAQNPMMFAVKEYEYCMEHQEDTEVFQDRFHKSLERMDDLKAWDYEARSKQILGQLGITNFDQIIKSLSGGQKKRVALAGLLIQEPEFIILDEPTNHLDLDMIEWLEGYLVGLNKTLLLVTHDRYFLDRICTDIIEIDNGKVYTYKGNYSYFLEKKEEREAQANTVIDKARNLYRKELDWMRRQPRARGTKQKARIDSFYETEAVANQSRVDQKLNLGVNMSRMGNKILEVEKISKAYGDKVLLDKFSYIFKRKERIGIVGKNGVGKSTFIKMLLELELPDSGTISAGETIVFGHYSQDGLVLPEDKRVIEVVKEIAEFIPVGNGETLSASQFLQYFLFPPSKHFTYVSKLSGGEKRRLHLLKILMKNPNFLILDEPTNDLDIITLNVLEEFLVNFGGCLIVITHDRYFMDKLVDHIFVFEGEGIVKDFNSNYSDYRDKQLMERDAKKDNKSKVSSSVSLPKAEEQKNSGKKPSYNDTKEYESLEKEISQLEKKKSGLELKICNISEHKELMEVSDEINKVTGLLETKTKRWLELAEIL
jgi:ATP-binding cassette subfamily F protein uup